MNIERKNSVRIFLDIFFQLSALHTLKERHTDRQTERQTDREQRTERTKKVSIDHKIFMFFFLICFNRLLNFVCEVKGRIYGGNCKWKWIQNIPRSSPCTPFFLQFQFKFLSPSLPFGLSHDNKTITTITIAKEIIVLAIAKVIITVLNKTKLFSFS